VEIVYAVADVMEIVRWSLGWGGEAEVLAPEDARRAAREMVSHIAERYAG
jgi:predicted DNA-binding transcriptional regulator YafY